MAKRSVDYRENLIESLKDPEEAIAYLRATLEENDMPEVFLLALRNVAEARGMQWLAREAHLNRESLYRMLSENGNPELRSLHALLSALGLRLALEPKEAQARS